MFETVLQNPFLLLCGMVLCWPGIIPMAAMFYVARRYDFRNPFINRRAHNARDEI